MAGVRVTISEAQARRSLYVPGTDESDGSDRSIRLSGSTQSTVNKFTQTRRAATAILEWKYIDISRDGTGG